MEPLKCSTNSKEGRKGKKKEKVKKQQKGKKRHNKIVDLKPSIHIITFFLQTCLKCFNRFQLFLKLFFHSQNKTTKKDPMLKSLNKLTNLKNQTLQIGNKLHIMKAIYSKFQRFDKFCRMSFISRWKLSNTTVFHQVGLGVIHWSEVKSISRHVTVAQ